MKLLPIPTASITSVGIKDYWQMAPADLERIAVALLGSLPGGWVRQGDNFIRVGNVKYGSNARKLDAELVALSAEAQRILSVQGPESVLIAAAFYHLRFENIHPLCEANGRTGRAVLALQLQQSLGVPANDLLTGLKDWEADYSRLFAANDGSLMFELLLDLLSRITGIALPPEASKLPTSIEPLHPQKNIPKNAPRLHPEKGLENPELIKKFAQQSRPPQQNQFYRKFR